MLPLDRENQRVPQDSDRTYLERRAQQSLAAESVATDRSARLAHGQLAAAYARRSTSDGDGDAKGILFPDTPAASSGPGSAT